MQKRSLSLLLLIACCLTIASCGPSRRSQTVQAKRLVPEITQFVDNNDDFLQALINISKKMLEYSERTPTWDKQSNHYGIYVYNNEVDFGNYGFDPYLYEDIVLITDNEKKLIADILLKSSPSQAGIVIEPNKVYFTYAQIYNTSVIIRYPSIEIADSGIYTSRVEFTEPLTDDWCIYICNFKATLF